jgi:hypothetical protein
MSKKNKNHQNGSQDVFSWKVPEYDRPARSRNWYIIAGILAVLIIGYAVWDKNYIFALFMLIAAVIVMFFDKNDAQLLDVIIDRKGLKIGSSFYEINELKDFFIIYRPEEGIKNLYFHFKSAIRHRLSIPLVNTDPVAIRGFLRRYLQEDLDKTNQPLSESLSKLLKL